MGRDKALLPFGATPLVVHVAQVVAAAAGSATLVGSRDRYGGLGWPVVEDNPPGDGPLGGMIAALGAAQADRNLADRSLIVACDMPWLSREILHALVQHVSKADVVAVRSQNGIEPLCAVYHRRCLPTLREALGEGDRTVRRVLTRLKVEEWPLADARTVYNANTPEDWAAVEAGG
jgi:molybdopterin-guanine dinucleotide biosynthesis protein A